jgi:uncharacterized membrane protein
MEHGSIFRRLIIIVKTKTALSVILVIGICGLLFSGYLTYTELFTKTGLSCPSCGRAGTVLGYPACIYGFFMYLAIVIVTSLGLLKEDSFFSDGAHGVRPDNKHAL